MTSIKKSWAILLHNWMTYLAPTITTRNTSHNNKNKNFNVPRRMTYSKSTPSSSRVTSWDVTSSTTPLSRVSTWSWTSMPRIPNHSTWGWRCINILLDCHNKFVSTWSHTPRCWWCAWWKWWPTWSGVPTTKLRLLILNPMWRQSKGSLSWSSYCSNSLKTEGTQVQPSDFSSNPMMHGPNLPTSSIVNENDMKSCPQCTVL